MTDEMGMQVAGLSSRYENETLAAIRSSHTPSELSTQIWTIARTFKEEMADEIARLPNDILVGMLPYVSNLHSMFRSRMGKPRSDTYEVSNIGTLKGDEEDGKWKIKRVVFTQSGMGTGPAFSFNVASVVGGDMVISVTGLEGVVESGFMDEVSKDVGYALKCIGQGKEIPLGR